MISNCHPGRKKDCVALSADGMIIPLQAAPGLIMQRYFYNGWKQGHFISNTFVFASDGKIPIMAMNIPGSMHYSKI